MQNNNNNIMGKNETKNLQTERCLGRRGIKSTSYHYDDVIHPAIIS